MFCFAVSIGNNPNSVADVWGTNGARRYAMPFRVMPDLGQVSENLAHPSTKQHCHVLHDRVARSYQANGSKKPPPEAGTLTGKAGACACKADVLARKSADDDIGLALSEFSRRDVVVNRDIWPVLGEDTSAVGIDLAEGDGSHAGALEAE